MLKSITTVMLALTTPVMWTFVLICITGTQSHWRYSYALTAKVHAIATPA